MVEKGPTVRQMTDVTKNAETANDDITQRYWFHSIRLSDGRITPGVKSLELMEREFALVFDPISLIDRSVLDIGAWNGGFSIEAKRRGANRVVAMDHATWNNPQLRGRETFDLAVRLCNLDIEAIDQDLDDRKLILDDLGQFDVVLFLGVFYHLMNPLAALREVAARARDVLVVETHIENALERPYMEFYPDGLNNDKSNYWGPNRQLIEHLLRRFGFDVIHYSEGSDPVRGVFHAFRCR